MSIGDARFFARSGPYPLATVADAAGGTAAGTDLLLTGVAPLQTAGPDEVSFLDNRRYGAALEQTSAGAVIVHPDMLARVPTGTVPIVTTEPYAGWARGPLPCSIRRRPCAPACILRRSSRTARPSTPPQRSGLSLWSRPGQRSAPAAGLART